MKMKRIAFCRSLYATFDEEVNLKGVPAWKTSVPAEIFDSPSIRPENECYCIKEDSPICDHSGAIGISSCQSGKLYNTCDSDIFFRR